MSETYYLKKITQDKIDEVYRNYHDLVNMSASELERWSENECSKGASLDRSPIRRNLTLLRTPKDEWGAVQVRNANRTISFISRMRGAEQGEPIKVNGKSCPSKRDISLKNWAFDPRKTRKELTVAQEADEDKAYADALKRMFNAWESEILKLIDEELTDVDKSYTTKGLRDLIMRLGRVMITNPYTQSIMSAIETHYKQGILDAEEEVGLDVGLTDAMKEDIVQITQRQLDGFAIDEIVWSGINGVSVEARDQIVEAITESMQEGTSRKIIKERVREVMSQYTGRGVTGEITQTRIDRIARTEANRIRNEGRSQTYTDSGVKGVMVWNAVNDNRTSEICNELHGKEVPVGEQFYSTVSNQYYKVPPAHVNCRSRVNFKPL